MESFFEKLSKFTILDIYDEIAEIPITDEQLISICSRFPCRVDLRRGNLLYPVMQKYKQRLSTYNNAKALKWLTKNLSRMIPNPEAKYLKWQELHQRNAKIEWLERKAEAVGQLPPLIDGSSDSDEESLRNERRLSAISRRTYQTDSTVATAQTVIPSQPKTTQETTIDPELVDLIDFSKSSILSEELPPLVSSTSTSSRGVPPEAMDSPSNRKRVQLNHTSPSPKRTRFSLLQESEDFSTQDQYASFTADHLVTSTQEFG